MGGERRTKPGGPFPGRPPQAQAGRAATELDPRVRPRHHTMAAAIQPGQILRERYRIVERLGTGGMGAVWLAEHTVIGKQVAIKVLHPERLSDDMRGRFTREARVIADLRHENVVEITDFGNTEDGAPYFVMELLRGSTVHQLLREQGRQSWATVQPWLLSLADALTHVHGRGIIHRDLKPENVFLVHSGQGDRRCKIIDFGIAKLTMLEEDATEFTRTGMVFGTPSFMSPEQARGEEIDVRTDVYSLGCIAYELLTGLRPFPGRSSTEVIYKQLFEHPVRMTQIAPDANIPPEVEAIVMMAMRKAKELRFADMAEMKRALEAVGTGAPPIDVPAERLPPPPKRAQTRFATAPQGSATPPPHVAAPRPISPTSASASLELDVDNARSASSWGTMAIAALVLVAAGVGGYWAFTRSDPPSADAPVPATTVAPDPQPAEPSTAPSEALAVDPPRIEHDQSDATEEAETASDAVAEPPVVRGPAPTRSPPRSPEEPEPEPAAPTGPPRPTKPAPVQPSELPPEPPPAPPEEVPVQRPSPDRVYNPDLVNPFGKPG